MFLTHCQDQLSRLPWQRYRICPCRHEKIMKIDTSAFNKKFSPIKFIVQLENCRSLKISFFKKSIAKQTKTFYQYLLNVTSMFSRGSISRTRSGTCQSLIGWNFDVAEACTHCHGGRRCEKRHTLKYVANRSMAEFANILHFIASLARWI